MKPRDLFVETWSALDANRGRSFLTVLGIVIGISAVIAMTSLIGGINQALVGELGLGQAQMVTIGIYTGQDITYDDVDNMARDLNDYEYMVASSSGDGVATTGQKKANARIEGVKPLYFAARNTKFAQGRAFTEAEEAKGSLVVILDINAVKKLYGSPDEEVVGKTITIGNNQYSIVGVEESDGSSMYGETINLYMPFSTCAARVVGNNTVSQIYGFAYEGADMDAVVKRTTDYVAATYHVPDDKREEELYIFSMKSMIDSMNATMGAFSLIMTAVASVSLLVGGIGIMNMMLTNVTERIREIGLRKALGARRSDITMQFMLESICLCLLGGLLGVILGYVGALALSGVGSTAFLGEGSTMKVTPYVDGGTVLMVTSICVGIGVLFGWYPARRAARLDPVESLHYQ